MSLDTQLLYVAQIGKSIGLKGEMKLHIVSDFLEQFKKDAIFFDEDKNEYQLESFNTTKSSFKIKDIDTIEQTKQLTNKKLYSSKNNTILNCKLEKDEYFYFDILGCNIIENNTTLGVVSKIDRFCNSDFLLIKTSKDMTNINLAKSFLIPYEDHYIQNVDIKNKKILVKNSFDILEQS